MGRGRRPRRENGMGMARGSRASSGGFKRRGDDGAVTGTGIKTNEQRCLIVRWGDLQEGDALPKPASAAQMKPRATAAIQVAVARALAMFMPALPSARYW